MAIFNSSRPDSEITVTADDVEKDTHKGLVAPRYMGTLADQRDMSALGRVQVLRVSGLLSILEAGPDMSSETFDLSPLLGLDVH